MANNAKEEINFHDFLKVMRKARHATLEQLSEGLCSVSMMKRIESGERLPEKLMRDRILVRLGVALEKYEDYLSEEEYEQWKLRQKILINIQRRKISDAEQCLAEYEKADNRNVVEQQFCEAMKLMILQLKKTSVSLQQEVIEYAVKLTIPNYKEGLSESMLLSEQEINLLIEYLRMQPYESMSVSEFEYRLKQYKDLIVYIQHSKIDKLGRAKIYPKAVYDMCEMILYQSKTKENLQYGLDVCIQAIEVLRDSGKLYYFIELLDVQQKIGKEIINYSEKEEQEKVAAILKVGQEWKKVLLVLYMEYDVSPYMEDFCYLYWETESYCIGDVIRIRRKMLGLSKKQLCAGICSEKTLTRIESKKQKRRCRL